MPTTAVAPFITTNVVALSVVAFIALLNVAVMDGFLGTSVAAFRGPVVRTDGAPFGLLLLSLLHPAARNAADASRIVKPVRWCFCVIWCLSREGQRERVSALVNRKW